MEYARHINSGDYKAGFSLKDAFALGLSFSHFDLNLDKSEENILAALAIDNRARYNNYGKIDALENEVSAFFRSELGNTPDIAARAANIISKIAKDVQEAAQAESAWVLLSVGKPAKSYDTPRWHTDVYHSAEPDIPDPSNLHKVVITLKSDAGATTLFKDLTRDQRDKFNACAHDLRTQGINMDELPARMRLAAVIADAPLSRARIGQGSLFLPEGDNAAVHSEPPIHESRLFMSIVAGTKEQIEGLQKRHSLWAVKFSEAPTANVG